MAVTWIRKKEVKFEPIHKFTDKAVRDLEGLFPVIDWPQVDDMISNSSPVTHDLGNRRYEDYVFLLEDGEVHGAGYYEAGIWGADAMALCPACKDTGKVKVYDVCSSCDGEGCPRCEDGLVASTISCQEPDCKKSKKVTVVQKLYGDQKPVRRRRYA